MASRSLTIDRTIDEIWPALQLLATWEGIGGMRDLRGVAWNEAGDLVGFAFSIETPLGTIDDRADVESEPPTASEVRGSTVATLHAVADSKGVRIDVTVELSDVETEGTAVEFSIEGRSTSFLTKPLVGALRETLESGIDREGQRLADRLLVAPLDSEDPS